MSHVHGIGTWEPFLMWVGPDVEANLRRALRFAQALVCDSTLGMNRSLRTRLWAQAGIAYGRGRALRPGSSPLGDEVVDLFGKGVSDVGRRASRLGHAAPAGAIIIDDWALRRLEPSTLSGVEVLPVTVADGKGGWLLPAETVHGLVIDQAA